MTYPTDITTEEQSAGYSVMDIEHLEPGSDKPHSVQAVCAEIDKVNRVVKLRDPNNQVWYRHQRRGFWTWQGADGPPRWLPVFEAELDPKAAIASATANKDKQSNPEMIW